MFSTIIKLSECKHFLYILAVAFLQSPGITPKSPNALSSIMNTDVKTMVIIKFIFSVQIEMLKSLGIQSTLISDGSTPINLYQGGNGPFMRT